MPFPIHLSNKIIHLLEYFMKIAQIAVIMISITAGNYIDLLDILIILL
jgi:hypothetical protein